MLMAYGGSWNMSGVLPARAVCGEGDGTPTPAAYAGARCLSRWDSVDPSQGGASQRAELLMSYRRWSGTNELEAMAFALHSNLQLDVLDCGICADVSADANYDGPEVSIQGNPPGAAAVDATLRDARTD